MMMIIIISSSSISQIHLEDDWTNFLSVILKRDQSDFLLPGERVEMRHMFKSTLAQAREE